MEEVSLTLSSDNQNDSARSILGDRSIEEAAQATRDLELVDPEEKKERKPRSDTGQPRKRRTDSIEDTRPSPAQMLMGESCVETQALTVSVIAGLFLGGEQGQAIYNLHIQQHKQKLSVAYAMCAKEFGIEVTGKMAALSMLATAELGLGRDIWSYIASNLAEGEKKK
jgi:hypothetical protein